MDTSLQEQSSQIIRSTSDSASLVNILNREIGTENQEELKYSLGNEEIGSQEERLEGDAHTTILATNQEDAVDAFSKKKKAKKIQSMGMISKM